MIPMRVELELCKSVGTAVLAKLGADAATSFVKSYVGEKIGGAAVSAIVLMNPGVEGYLCKAGMEVLDGMLEKYIGNLIT